MDILRVIVLFLFLRDVSCSGWNYDTLGPDVWKIDYPTSCGIGQKQSPINIITAATAYDSTLADITFNNYSSQIQWNITNNGHTIVATQQDSNPVPSITGSNYGKVFSLAQFHFHWGFNAYQGSEHLINYQKYPLELHLVHKASDGTLAVVGFLFNLSSTNNTALSPILNAAVYDSVSYRSMLLNFSLSSILPSASVLQKSGYFRYAGSLTTPPCTEGVIWTVYNYQLTISESQLQVFRNNSVLANFRDTQQLYSRLVYSSIKNLGYRLTANQIGIIFLCFIVKYLQ